MTNPKDAFEKIMPKFIYVHHVDYVEEEENGHIIATLKKQKHAFTNVKYIREDIALEHSTSPVSGSDALDACNDELDLETCINFVDYAIQPENLKDKHREKVEKLFNFARLAEQALEGMAWQPIETAPKDGTSILLYGLTTFPTVKEKPNGGCFHTRGKEMSIEIGAWCNHAKQWGLNKLVSIEPTHWMPLPKIPC